MFLLKVRKPIVMMLVIALILSVVHAGPAYAAEEYGGDAAYENGNDYAPYIPDLWDLRNFVQGVEVIGQDGEALDPQADTLQVGSTYTFLIDFSETSYMPFGYNSDGVLVYELPSGLQLINADGRMAEGFPEASANVAFDTYEGLVSVQFGGFWEYVSVPGDTETLSVPPIDDDEEPDDEELGDEEPKVGDEESNDEEATINGEESAANDDNQATMEEYEPADVQVYGYNPYEDHATTEDDELELEQAISERFVSYIDYYTDMSFTLRIVAELTEEDYFLDFGNGFLFFPFDDEFWSGEGGFAGIMPLLAMTSSDLADFVTTVNMFDMNGNPITSGTSTYIGQNYKFEVTFAESPTLQLAYDPVTGHLLYQLPSYLTIQNPIDVTPLYSPDNASIIIGWYTISTAGLVQVWFDNVDLNGNAVGVNFIDYYSNVTIVLDIFAQLESVPDGNIDFGNGVVVTIDPPQPPAPSLTMHKSSRYVPNPPAGASASWFERVYYMITITALDGIATNITLTDTPQVNGASFYDPIADTPPGTPSAFSGFTYTVNRMYAPPGGLNFMTVTDWTSSPLSFTYTFMDSTTGLPLVLNPGDFITVRYLVNIPVLVENNNNISTDSLYGQSGLIHNFTLNNYATVTGDPIYTGPPLPPVSDNTTDNIRKELAFSKSGVINPGNNSITWTITVGDGVSIPLNGGTLTDIINAGAITLPLEYLINLRFFNNAGVDVYDDSFAAFELQFPGDYTRTATGFELTVPANSDIGPAGTPIGDIYQLVVEYTTPIMPPQQGEPVEVFGNNASFNFPDGTGTGPGINVTVPVRPAPIIVTKTTSGICGSPDITTPNQQYWVDYTITVQVPAGLRGEPLYLYDNLGLFPGGSSVPNVPVPIPTPGYTFISVVPDPDEAGVPFLYTDAIPFTGNSWRIFFGTTGNTVPAASYWPFNLPAVMTVSYRIYLSDAVVATMENPNASHYISNAVYLINSVDVPNIGSLGNSVGSTNVNDYWPILKHVQATANPALFNYSVTIKGGYSARTAPLLQAGNNPVFMDTFNAGLAYVPGSFYVVDTGISGRYYMPTGDVTVSGNSFSVDLSADWQQFSGTFPSGTLVGAAPANWFAQHRDFTFYYQLQVADTTVAQANMVNTARITVNPGECAFESSQTVNFTPPQNVSKNMTPVASGSNRLNVEVIINPDGEFVFSDGVNPGPAQITAVDNLVNLMMFTDSIQIYTQTKVNGVWNGVWIPQPFTFNDRQLWSVNITPQANVPTGVDSQVQFVLPNQTPIKIDYAVGVTLPAGTSGDISNEISIFGEGDSSDKSSYVVGGGGAGVGAGMVDLRVFKQDAVGNNLMGATFDLYVTVIGSYQPPGELTDDLTITGAGGQVLTFGLIEEVVTDANGMALFSGEQWITSDPRFYLLYMLVESRPPVGYEPIYQDIFFTLNPTMTAAQIADLNTLLAPVLLPDESVNQVSDFVTVTNVPSNLNPGNLRIYKAFEGLTDAQVQQYLRNLQIVVTDPTGNQYIFGLADILNPNGMVLQNIPAGIYFIEERFANIPNFVLTTSPQLPTRRYIMPNDAGEVVLSIVNTYTPYPNLTLQKTFYIDGIAYNSPPDGASAISFLIIGSDFNTGAEIFRTTVPYSAFVNNTYVLRNLPPGIYVMYETGGYAAGYTFYNDGGLLGVLPLMAGANVTVPISNIYTTIPPEQLNPGLLIRKSFHGLASSEFPQGFAVTVTGGPQMQTWTFSLLDIIEGRAFIPNVQEGTYIITESGFSVPGFDVQIQPANPIHMVIMPDDVYKVIQVVFDNFYTPTPPAPPTVPPGHTHPPIDPGPPWPPIWPHVPPTTTPPGEPPAWPPEPPPAWPPDQPWPPTTPPATWPAEPPTWLPPERVPATDVPDGDIPEPRPNPQTGDNGSMNVILLIGIAFMSIVSAFTVRRFVKSNK